MESGIAGFLFLWFALFDVVSTIPAYQTNEDMLNAMYQYYQAVIDYREQLQ